MLAIYHILSHDPSVLLVDLWSLGFLVVLGSVGPVLCFAPWIHWSVGPFVLCHGLVLRALVFFRCVLAGCSVVLYFWSFCSWCVGVFLVCVSVLWFLSAGPLVGSVVGWLVGYLPACLVGGAVARSVTFASITAAF